jgi:hypothetical protein
VAKEGYKPTAGMQSAARRAIKYKEDGKAKGAGTAVGWTRAGQLARGESLSLDTVKRMYSFFSRHEVDKQGKDWDNATDPSNGKIMWLAWGGDAGFSWSRKIVEREKRMKKSSEVNEFIEEVKSILTDVVDPITEVIDIEEGTDLEKAAQMCDCPDCKSMDMSCDNCEKCMSKSYESDDEETDKWDNVEKACWTGYKQQGMKDKNGRMVPNCVPVEKVEKTEGQLIVNEEERRILENSKPETVQVKKSVWTGSLDPVDFVKRKFNTETRHRMAESGNAMPDGSYPIGNRNDLENAIRSWGRGGSDPKVKAHIKRRAKELGAEDMIPDNWK